MPRGEDVELSGGTFKGSREESGASGRFNGGGAHLRATTQDGTIELIAR